MATVTLLDGKELTLDLYKISVKDWREFVDRNGDPEAETRVIANVTGLTVAEVEAMAWVDYKRIAIEIIRRVNAPLSDPN